MMKNYQPYPAYKDSGVEWLGEIPEHWELGKNRNVLQEKKRPGYSGLPILSVSIHSGVSDGELSGTENLRGQIRIEDKSSYKLVGEGDIAYNMMRAWQGGIGRVPRAGMVSPAYVVASPRGPLNTEFFEAQYRTPLFVSQMNRASRGITDFRKRLYWEDFKALEVILPPVAEQTAIANFLKDKTAKIDKAIAQKEQLIALLKERKQIIIQTAVTKGLDPEVKMKDSGIEWIGEIPEHWSLKKLRHLGRTQNGISAGAEYFGSGYPFVSYSNVFGNTQLPELVEGLARSSDEDREQYSVSTGDVFFTRTSETAEEVGFSSTCFKTIEDATFAGFLIRFRPESNLLIKEFSKYYFSSHMMRDYFVKEMNLVTRASLSQSLLKDLLMALPPLEEQREIFNFLESRINQFGQAQERAIRIIQKLREYKATLIDSAVTGKIDVSQRV